MIKQLLDQMTCRICYLDRLRERIQRGRGFTHDMAGRDPEQALICARRCPTTRVSGPSDGERPPKRSTNTYSSSHRPVLRPPVESGQHTAIRYSNRLIDAGALASIGTVGDSYDNAMAESVIGLYKTECVRHDGPFRTVDDLELATLSWVHWFNTIRLHSSLGCRPPAEFETEHYRQTPPREHSQSGQPNRQ